MSITGNGYACLLRRSPAFSGGIRSRFHVALFSVSRIRIHINKEAFTDG